MPIHTRGFGFVRELPRDVDKTRTIPFVISSSKRDRHGTVVNMRNWSLDNYRMNPIVGYQHDLYGGNFFQPDDPNTAIGYSRIAFEGDYMIGYCTFETEDVNPLAEKIFKKIKFGSIRAASVGFLEVGKGRYGFGDEAKGGKNQTYYYAGQELLEWSVVKIQSNTDAVVQDSDKARAISKSKFDYKMQLLTSRMKWEHPNLYKELMK